MRRAALLAVDREGRRERRRAGGQRWIISPPHAAALGRHLALELLEPAARARRSEADRRPVAQHLAPLLAQPVGGLAHAPMVSASSTAAGLPSAATGNHRVRVQDGMSIARVAEPSGSLQEAKEWGLDREDLLGIYRNMLLTRGVEDRGHILYRQGKIPGSFYTGRGNEASSVAVATAMGRDDVGTPLHRDMGVHITRGVEPWRIFAQLHGPCRRAGQGPRRQRPHGRHPPRTRRDGLATCPRCSRSPSAARSRSASRRRSASRSAGSARAPPRAATRTRR